MRVLYELAHRDAPTAADLGRDLGLDAGYLSRILRRFESRGLLGRHAVARRRAAEPAAPDARRDAPPSRRSKRAPRGEVEALLGRLADAGPARRSSTRWARSQRLLGAPPRPADRAAPYLLRAHQPGDMGWVVHRHGALYAREWGYNAEFEALVARICADFLDHFDPARERCWIAERDGAIVGSVFLVRKSKTVAKLRLLLVEPSARGLGIGRRLVDECIRFARAGRLPQADAVDAERARRGAPALSAGRLPLRPHASRTTASAARISSPRPGTLRSRAPRS